MTIAYFHLHCYIYSPIGQGINLVELQEAIITQAELMNLKGDPVGLVEGRIVESKVDSKQG